MPTGSPKTQQAVTVSLKDLEAGNVPLSALEEAFGPASLGIIVVKDLPPRFEGLRHQLLSLASKLGNLPPKELEALEVPSAKWLVGWSCGKETLKDGKYDTLKGSYYVNCAFYKDPNLTGAEGNYPNFPEYTAPNIWPPESLVPDFRSTFERLCTLIIDTAALVARACDLYAEKNIPDYRPGYLEHVVRTSTTTKARLLHYFPPITENAGPSQGETEEKCEEDDDWCATHVDHGCLTGLTSAMFIGESSPSQEELPSPPDPKAGLYIRSRVGETVKVRIPCDCLAFQTGEALELITRGRFKAVPHFVKGIRSKESGDVARNTLAVFTQPNLHEMVDETRDFAAFAKEVVERNR